MRFADRVLETTTTEGTGTYALDGAEAGHRSFEDALGSGPTTLVGYVVTDGDDWEVGYGTHSTSPDQLTRAAVLASSNGGAAVNWGDGSKYVYSAPIASVVQSLIVSFIGTSRPGYARAGTLWTDNSSTPWVRKFFDGANDIALYNVDATNNRALFEGVKGADIASASTVNLGAATGELVHVTGTTTITALGTADEGVRRIVVFDGALVLRHTPEGDSNDAALVLPGGANITTAAGDIGIFVSEGGGDWRCASYTRADGKAVVSPTAGPTVQVFTSNGTWTRPSGCRRIKIFCTAGGGGGGGTSDVGIACGGGGGETAISWIDVTSLSSAAVVVGAGGTAGSNSGGQGGTGGDSTFNGTAVVAKGGIGGLGVTGSDSQDRGGLGGSGGTGDVLLAGGGGGGGFGGIGTFGGAAGGHGGASYWGGGAPGGGMQSDWGGSLGGTAGSAWGSGGSGARSDSGAGNQFGGAGKGGIVVVEEFY